MMLGSADNNVRLNSDFSKFRDRLLGWFGFDFSCGFHHWKEGDVNEADVFRANFECELAERFKEKVALDIANRSANLGNYNIRITIFLSGYLESSFNLVRDMGDELNCGT
jgi:hypothetical protein